MRDGIVGLRGKDMGLCATGLRVTHDKGMGLCGRGAGSVQKKRAVSMQGRAVQGGFEMLCRPACAAGAAGHAFRATRPPARTASGKEKEKIQRAAACWIFAGQSGADTGA